MTAAPLCPLSVFGIRCHEHNQIRLTFCKIFIVWMREKRRYDITYNSNATDILLNYTPWCTSAVSTANVCFNANSRPSQKINIWLPDVENRSKQRLVDEIRTEPCRSQIKLQTRATLVLRRNDGTTELRWRLVSSHVITVSIQRSLQCAYTRQCSADIFTPVVSQQFAHPFMWIWWLCYASPMWPQRLSCIIKVQITTIIHHSVELTSVLD